MEEKGKLKHEIIIIAVLALLFIGGIVFYGKLAGILIITSLLVFGALSFLWKDGEVKLTCLAVIVILAIANIGINGLKFGIDFSGGTRIPILLEKPVDQVTMDNLIQTIKKRVSVLGLSEAKVKAIGDSEIDVELPSSDMGQIEFIENTLSHQGIYTGVVDGKIAIAGEDVYSQTIQPINSANALQQLGADWGVSFSISKEGGQRFADAAKGKANYPVYMFLDRPDDAIIVITRKHLRKNTEIDIAENEVLNSVEDALRLEGKSINLYIIDESPYGTSISKINGDFIDDFDNNTNLVPKTNKTKALVANSTDQKIKEMLQEKGFAVTEFPDEEISPVFSPFATANSRVESWEAIGLLSAPSLSPQITTGIPGYNYVITGAARGDTLEQKRKDAADNERKIESVLKGGSLPVQISLGSRTSIPPTLGNEFLKLSLIGIVAALVAISILIGVRYAHIKAIIPIIIVSISELLILLSILGSFTIDLAAIAGIIAAIGVGVDAQIVITDEIFKKNDKRKEEKLEQAFAIIKTNVIVAIVAMVPLLFSSLFEVIGFAISTILGALLGFLLTRPAYAVLVERIVD